jgi:hypothetical protein
VRLKWKKVGPGPMDRHMASNGAHALPVEYHLCDEDGKQRASVRRVGPSYTWGALTTSGGVRSGKVASIDRAKELAKEAARS